MQVAFFLCAKTSIRGEPFNWKLVLFKQHFFYNNLFQALCQRGRLKKWWAGDERGLVEKEGATFPFHSRIPLATDPACCPLAFSIVLADREPTKFHVFAGNTDVMLNPKDLDTSLCAVFKMADELKIGFIGGGNMAKAIARGFITSEMVKAANIIASATTTKTLAVWKVK